MRLIRFLRDLGWRYPHILVANVSLLLVLVLVDATSVLTLAPIVDAVTLGDGVTAGASVVTVQLVGFLRLLGISPELPVLLGLFVLLLGAKALAETLLAHFILRTKYAVLREMLVGVYRDFFRARWGFFSRSSGGVLLNTFMRETAQVGDGFGAMAHLLAGIGHLLLYLCLPLYLSWQVTLLCLVVGLGCALPILALSNWNYRLGQENTRTSNAMMGVIHESLGAAKTVLGFAAQEKVIADLAGRYEEHRSATLRSQTLLRAIPLLYRPLGFLVLAFSLLYGRHLGLPSSELLVLLYSLSRMIPVIGQISTYKSQIDNFFPSYEQVRRLQQEARDLRQTSGETPFEGLGEGIAVRGVRFAYPGGEACLRDLDLEIPRGRMTAIVGESGAGKSTLLDLLLGFDDPQAGVIEIAGTDLREFDLDGYRSAIGYVPQTSVLFHESIRENIRWAREDASDADIQAACDAANVTGFLDDLPEGLDTVVGDRGVRLSGGQLQRVALARALVRDPCLLLLDEATSALDSESEHAIQRALEEEAEKRTVVLVAHRLSTVVHADQILLLERGRVRERGSYAELVAAGGAFARMVELQTLQEEVRGSPSNGARDADAQAPDAGDLDAGDGRARDLDPGDPEEAEAPGGAPGEA